MTSSVSSTGGKLTHVRDPRATVRFSLDEQVGWDEGNKIVKGTIVGFVEDDTMARVRLRDGSVVLWPTFSARLKRVQTADFEEDRTAADPAPPTERVEAIEPTMPAPSSSPSGNVHLDEVNGNDANDGSDWEHAIATMGRAMEILYSQQRRGQIQIRWK